MSEPALQRFPAAAPERSAAYIRDPYNLPCQASSLRTMACKGTGPAYRKGSRFPL